MTTLQTVSKGQSDWQENVNQTIQAVNSLMAGVEPTHLTNPVTYLNGTTGNGSEAWIFEEGSVKLVVVYLGFFKLAQNMNGKIVMQLPDTLKPHSEFQVPINQDGLITNGYNSAGPTTDVYYFNWNSSSGDTSLGDRRATLIYIANN